MYELVTLARGGVLLTVWALAAGWPRGRLAVRLRGDGWQRICRGAWAVPGKEVDWRVRAGAVQLLRPELVCSHRTAAALHRIELLADGARGADGPEPLEFTAPGGGASGGRIHVHGTAGLTDRDCVVRRGLRVTGPARTVADLIRAAAIREEAVVVADSALSRRCVAGRRREPLVGREELAAALAVPRRPGAPRARRWLPLARPGSGSPAETVARLRMGDAGLFPEVQPALRSGAGRALHPDFYFRAAGLVVEIEGFAFHGTREAHERDVRRFNELQSCPGVRRVLRFTAREVFDRPDRMTATIREALGSLGAPPRAGPGGVGAGG
ncbi:DUF559 domain-containing protein [Streptomyces showdoensis]|uniref:DUF559 domain-containing protein n=1 Tax=Streptomyces showdoensis TaxID=68268 RepID=A0A2P2GL69_STREW|nr:DUF559 domain-containing protein [Streptomyces showdoensis]KKZ71555.1 hypothetical protein VO63_22940 [Streptomyces showdoensis]